MVKLEKVFKKLNLREVSDFLIRWSAFGISELDFMPYASTGTITLGFENHENCQEMSSAYTKVRVNSKYADITAVSSCAICLWLLPKIIPYVVVLAKHNKNKSNINSPTPFLDFLRTVFVPNI